MNRISEGEHKDIEEEIRKKEEKEEKEKQNKKVRTRGIEPLTG